MNQRLMHDCALMMAEHLVELVSPCLREEEKLDARDEFYAVCRAGLEAYEAQAGRLHKRLHPTDN